MGYSSGMMRYRVGIYTKDLEAEKSFGTTTEYKFQGCVWADVTWKKGQRALNEGALDSVDTVLVRMRWNSIVTRESRLECEGITYQIQSMHPDRHANTIQITATEIVT